MSEISVGMPRRSHPFVDLYNVHLIPRDCLSGQSTEHDLGGMAAADRDDEAIALGDNRSSLCGDQCGCFSGYRIRICKYFDFHESDLQSRLACHCRVLPTSGRRDFLIDLIWSPRVRLVLIDGGARFQHRIDDSPRLFDIVFAGKQRRVAGHGVA
jgi:hypothetical protein